jgi:hypothetical protein
LGSTGVRSGAARASAALTWRTQSFFAILVDQLRCCSSRTVDVRPILERITLLEWRANDAGGDELAETALHFFYHRGHAWR